MARTWLGSFPGLLLVIIVVNARPPPMEQRDISKDDAVREMYELLHARRQLDESKPSNSEVAPSSTSQPILIDAQKELQEGGYASHTQLCTDGLKFLSTGSSDHEKRNLVINYVYNICIRPGIGNDVLGQFLDFAKNTQEDDWSNWPGFDLQTTPRTTLTTEDYWQQLLDELLFNVDIADDNDGNDVTTTQVINVYSTKKSLDSLLSDFINILEDEYGDVTTIHPLSESSGLENSLETFLQFLEQEGDYKVDDGITPTTSRTTTGVEFNSETDLEVALEDFLHLIEGLEAEQEPTTPKITTVSESTTLFDAQAAFNDFWNFIDELEEDATTTLSAKEDDNVLPPVDLNERTEMKKRLLKMLARSLAAKEAMRK